VQQAWELVYRSYRQKGLIDRNRFGVHLVPQSVQPHAIVVIGSKQDDLQTTVSCYKDDRIGLPLDAVYGPELDELRAQELQLFETGMFADQPDAPAHSPQELFELMRFPFYYGLWAGCTDMVIGVHPRHAAFYQRLIGFEAVGAEKTYGLVRDHPVVLLRLNLLGASSRERLPRGMRYFVDHPVPDAAFEARFKFQRDAIEASLRSCIQALAHRSKAGTSTGERSAAA
jgi:hypothetical protein